MPDSPVDGRDGALTHTLARLLLSIGPAAPKPSGGPGFRTPDPVPYRLDAVADDDAYADWLALEAERERERELELAAALAALVQPPLVSVVVPVYGPPPEVLEACVESVLRQLYPHWELCLCDDGTGDPALTAQLERLAARDQRIRIATNEVNLGIAAATNRALQLSNGELVAFLDHDDELHPHALAEIAAVCATDETVDVVYTDEDKIDVSGRRFGPVLKPAWSPDLLLSGAYMTHLFVVRRALVDAVGGLRSDYDGSQDYDLMLRATERARRIVHVARILYHWRAIEGSAAHDINHKSWALETARAAVEDALRRRGVRGTVSMATWPGYYHARRALSWKPHVSVVVRVREPGASLLACLESIAGGGGHDDWDAVLVDHGTWDPETRACIARAARDPRVRLHPVDRALPAPSLDNCAAAGCSGDVLLFLDSDLVGASDGWLAALLEHAQRTEVGAVGARIVDRAGYLEHAGVIVGLEAVAGLAFRGRPPGHAAYFGFDQVVRNWSAVGGGCLMVRRRDFISAGGLDESLPLLADIDLCLRLGELGRLVVFTPHAELVRQSPVRSGPPWPDEETRRMTARWGEMLERGDPFFNPALGRLSREFRMPTAAERSELTSTRPLIRATSSSA